MHSPSWWIRRVAWTSRRIHLGLQALEDRATPATLVWDGGGSDDLWSNAANWSAAGADRIPTPSDDIVFDGTSSKPATVDRTFLVNSVAVHQGYTGAVAIVGTASLAISGGLTIDSGTFTHVGDVLSVGGNIVVSGGVLAFGGIDLLVDGDWSIASTAAFVHVSDFPVTFNRSSGLQRLATGGTDANHDFAALRQLGDGTLRLEGFDLLVAGTLELEGGGTFSPSGQAVTVGGATTIRDNSSYQGGSSLQSLGGLNLGVATLSGDNLRVTGPITAGSESSGTATVTGQLDLGGAIRPITVSGPDDVLIVGAAVANGGIVKSGGGVLRLDGISTFLGTTSLDGGTLLVVGAIPSAVVVTSGFFGGNGRVGAVAAPGGEVAPGAGGPGVLTTGDLSLGGGTTLRIEIGGSAPGQFDRLDVAGTVTLENVPVTVSFPNAFGPALGQQFVVINNDEIDPVAGTFAQMPEGGSLTLNGQLFRITYVGGDGNDVELTATSPPVPSPLLYGVPQFATGADRGGPGTVRMFNPDGSEQFSVTAFDDSPGGVRTAVGDFNGDRVPDLVVGTGPGSRARVRVFDGATRVELFATVPFENSYTGGVFVAVGDITGDSRADLIVTPDVGGGPRVRIFGGTGFAQINDFFGIEDLAFRGGARVAVADVTGDGLVDLLVAAGTGGGPRVATFDGASVRSGVPSPTKPFGDIFVFEPSLRNGVFVAGGDLNGDRFADVIVGGGPGGGPRVYALSSRDLIEGRSVQLANFFVGNPSGRGGVRLAVKNLDGDFQADLVAGDGPGRGATVHGFRGATILPDGAPPESLTVNAFLGFTGGVYVG